MSSPNTSRSLYERTFRAVLGIGTPRMVAPWQWPIRMIALGQAILDDRRQRLKRSQDTIHHDWITRNEPEGHAQAVLERFERWGTDLSRVSVVIPVGHAPFSLLRSSLHSLHRQACPPCDIRLVCAPEVKRHRYLRLRWLSRFTPGAQLVRAATWRAATEGAAEWVLVLWPGDRLALGALQIYQDTAIQHPNAALLYGDEDQYDPQSHMRSAPLLKPGWAPVTLLTRPILGRTICIRCDVLAAIVPDTLPGEAHTGPDHLALALARLDIQGVRIPAFLLHRRTDGVTDEPNSPADAVLTHLKMMGLQEPTLSRNLNGTRRIAWTHPETPAVSIVIHASATTDAAIRRNVERLLDTTDYPHFDITYVTSRPPTRAATETDAFDRTVRCVAPADPSNRSASLSAAVDTVPSDLVLFLDPGIYPLTRSWLRELVQWLHFPGVGVVAPMIVSSDKQIHHVGYATGIGLLYGDLCHGLPEGSALDFLQPDDTRNVSAVSLRAMLMRKTTFNDAGPFDASYREQYADIVLCERVRKSGGQIVCHPGARLCLNTYIDEVTHEDTQRLAHRIAARPDAVDPYLHPRINIDDPTLPIQAAGALPTGARITQKTDAILATAGPSETIDLFDREALAALAQAHDFSFPPPAASAADAAQDVEGAARFLLQQLYNAPALRERFPHALSAGRNGAFFQWCNSEGADAWQLNDAARHHLAEVFGGSLSYRVRALFNWRWDLRFYFPLASLPWGRAAFVRWTKTDGAATGLTDTELWWFLLESAESPAREIATLYGLLPEWQRKHPPALTASQWPRLLQWMSRVYGIPHHELASLAPPTDRACPPVLATAGKPDHGVNLLGHLCLHSGNKQSVEVCMDGLRRVGLATSVRDVPAVPTGDPPDRREWLDTEVYDISINFLSLAFSLEGWYSKGTLQPRGDTYHIGNWFWEFQEVPQEWVEHAEHYDEAWAATRFIENIMKKALPIPVTYMPAGHLVEPPRLPRSHFGLPEDRYLFLFVFDMGSYTERKNPRGLIEAFRQAIRPDDRATLVLKFSQGQRFSETTAALRQDAARVDNVHIIDETYSREDTLGLINCCDCYVSLHRSEGLGLTIAEAMMMGKSAIATSYSGNLEFMTPENSLLVDYNMIAMEQDWPPYRKGWLWADPSVAHAAEQMRFVLDQPEEAAAIAARGQGDTRRHFDMQAYADRMAARLAAIRSTR